MSTSVEDTLDAWGHAFEEAQQRSQELGVNPKDLIGATKIPLGVVPASAIAGCSLAMYDGGVKYAPLNWRDIPVQYQTYIDAGIGHYESLKDGEDLDPVTGLHHAFYAMACAAIIIDAICTGSIIDNRYAKRRTRKGAFTRNPMEFAELMGLDPSRVKELLSKPLRQDPQTPAPTPPTEQELNTTNWSVDVVRKNAGSGGEYTILGAILFTERPTFDGYSFEIPDKRAMWHLYMPYDKERNWFVVPEDAPYKRVERLLSLKDKVWPAK
jgi:Domain of unknown function (DUF5664)